MSAGTRQRARRVPTTASARRAMREAVTVLLDQLLSVSPRSLSVESRSIPAESASGPRVTARLRSLTRCGPPRSSKYVLYYCGVAVPCATKSAETPVPNGNSNAPARASAERHANRGNVPAHPTVLLSLRGDATALDHGMGESRTDRLSVRVGSVGNRMSRIGKKGGAPCRASRVTYRAAGRGTSSKRRIRSRSRSVG